MSGARGREPTNDEAMDDRVTFRAPTSLLDRVEGWVEDGHYGSRTAAIRAALRAHDPEGGD